METTVPWKPSASDLPDPFFWEAVRYVKTIDDMHKRPREFRILRADQFGQFTIYADLVANGPAMNEGYAIINGEKVYIIGELELEES